MCIKHMYMSNTHPKSKWEDHGRMTKTKLSNQLTCKPLIIIPVDW